MQLQCKVRTLLVIYKKKKKTCPVQNVYLKIHPAATVEPARPRCATALTLLYNDVVVKCYDKT